MATYYKLVELTSGNVADDFDDLDEAMSVLSSAVETHGAAAMSTYSLLEVVDGAASLIAMEDELLALVARSPKSSAGREAQTLLVSTTRD